MKAIVLYYSFGGKTRTIAKAIAQKESAEIAEIVAAKRCGKLKAYTAGIIAAIRGNAWPILPLDVNLADYDRLILLSPIWADNTPPAFNAILGLLPEGKSIELKMVSMSGKNNCKTRLEAAIKAKKCILESFEDINSKT